MREAARGHLTRRLGRTAWPRRSKGAASTIPGYAPRWPSQALIGVLLARALGSFEELGQLGRDELITLVSQMLPDLSS